MKKEINSLCKSVDSNSNQQWACQEWEVVCLEWEEVVVCLVCQVVLTWLNLCNSLVAWAVVAWEVWVVNNLNSMPNQFTMQSIKSLV